MKHVHGVNIILHAQHRSCGIGGMEELSTNELLVCIYVTLYTVH